jgi:uncharacterized DUF497 family protein
MFVDGVLRRTALKEHPVDVAYYRSFLIIGMSNEKGVCIISHCYRGADETIRIISARKATKTEQFIYNQQF